MPRSGGGSGASEGATRLPAPPAALKTALRLLQECSSRVTSGQWVPAAGMLQHMLQHTLPAVMDKLQRHGALGTQFTCFTGAKVRILTQIWRALDGESLAQMKRLRCLAGSESSRTSAAVEQMQAELDVMLVRLHSCFDYDEASTPPA